MSFCEHCVQGHVLPGEPTGSIQLNKAYFSPASSDNSDAPSGTSNDAPKAVILLTDAFGLPLKNCKILADRLSNKLKCDVWVPDMFNGVPPLEESNLIDKLPETPGTSIAFLDKLRFAWMILTKLPRLIGNRASVLDARNHAFLKELKEEKKYGKIGVVGYCMGGSAALRLASTSLVDSAVVCHPGLCSLEEIKAIKVPTSWVCAEEDNTFGSKLRNDAEATFAARKDKPEFVDYEFYDYKGTCHGFAARPNLGIPVIKEAFEKSVEQTIQWFSKTL